jgi:hypothetical protein
MRPDGSAMGLEGKAPTADSPVRRSGVHPDLGARTKTAQVEISQQIGDVPNSTIGRG